MFSPNFCARGIHDFNDHFYTSFFWRPLRFKHPHRGLFLPLRYMTPCIRHTAYATPLRLMFVAGDDSVFSTSRAFIAFVTAWKRERTCNGKKGGSTVALQLPGHYSHICIVVSHGLKQFTSRISDTLDMFNHAVAARLTTQTTTMH